METNHSEHVHELLNRPLDIVNRLFAERQPQQDDVVVDSGLVAMLERLNIGKAVELPSLNHIPLDQLKDGIMVKYRGMVQDILNPEYYLAMYEEQHQESGQTNVKSARYRDVLDSREGFVVIDNSPSSKFGQRLRLYCVPIPGQTQWADNLLKPASLNQPQIVSNSSKDADMMEEDDLKPRQKRSRATEDESEALDPSAMQGIEDETTNEGQRSAPPTVGDAAEQRIKKDAAPSLNFPIPGSSGVPCVVKVYDDNEETFKVSDIVEFEGILSHRYEVQVAEGEDEEEHLMMRDYAPPPGLVPQLHCIRYRKLTSVHPHMASSASSQLISTQEWLNQRGGQVALEEARRAVIDHLSNCLFGDRLAAEYLLLHLLSKVYGRVTELDPLGNFPINYTQIPASVDRISIADYFRSFLSQLLPALHVVSLSREALQTSQFMPYKDYDHERLISGQLQLAAGTELVVDETALTEGQLEQKSYAQLLALGTLVSSQRVTYDFKYYQSDVPTDIPVLILSVGKSMFKSSVAIPITIDPNWRLDKTPQSDAVLAEVRFLLASLRTTDVKQSSEDMAKHLQDDFVAMRKADSTFTADMFRSWLTVSRLVAVSHGEDTVSVQRWEETKHLEAARIARVSQNTTQSS